MLAAVFWGLNYVATKYAADLFSPLLIMAFRLGVGSFLLFGVLRLLEPESKLARRNSLPVLSLVCLA
jgi:drug/metabolite transporter (DMT)-like permease